MKLSSRYLVISLSCLVILLIFHLLINNYLSILVFAASCETADCSSPEECQRKIQESRKKITLDKTFLFEYRRKEGKNL